jgi:hypothetical protein
MTQVTEFLSLIPCGAAILAVLTILAIGAILDAIVMRDMWVIRVLAVVVLSLVNLYILLTLPILGGLL